MSPDPDDRHAALREALRRVGSTLAASGVPFALCGGYGLWARGGPEPDHDVDFLIAEADVDAAVDALTSAKLEVDRPVEDWLFKVHLPGAFADVIHRHRGIPVERSELEQSSELEVLGIHLPVLEPTYLMSLKLLAMTEHYCDFAALLPAVRAVREQIDWPALRELVSENPFADALLVLCDRLGISAAAS